MFLLHTSCSSKICNSSIRYVLNLVQTSFEKRLRSQRGLLSSQELSGVVQYIYLFYKYLKDIVSMDIDILSMIRIKLIMVVPIIPA